MKREYDYMNDREEVWSEPTSVPTLIVIGLIIFMAFAGALIATTTHETDPEQAALQPEYVIIQDAGK